MYCYVMRFWEQLLEIVLVEEEIVLPALLHGEVVVTIEE
jgi:hypothetical protein